MTAAPPPTNPLSRYQLAADQAHAFLNLPNRHTLAEETYRWMIEGLMVLGQAELDIFVCWLLGSEARIASGEDGLGMLAPVFERLMDRSPQEKPATAATSAQDASEGAG